LGAQLLAAALGERVYRGVRAEIGTGFVSLTPDGSADPVLGAAGVDELAGRPTPGCPCLAMLELVNSPDLYAGDVRSGSRSISWLVSEF
jgi:hypothetical protein